MILLNGGPQRAAVYVYSTRQRMCCFHADKEHKINIVLIGNGAIAQYVSQKLVSRGHMISAVLLKPARVADFPVGVDHVIDCAGHSGLLAHGAQVLRAGYDMTTLSRGALADQELFDALNAAGRQSGARLHLASGAIGALDCLRAANVGTLSSVRYVGRKPPQGWIGSPAETLIDLKAIADIARTHFKGSARHAAIEYPKNANVAAAVAVAGIGFDRTQVELVADPTTTENIHEATAQGDFGSFQFGIPGQPMLDNPRVCRDERDRTD